MVNQSILAQLLKFSSKFYVLIHEYFYWSTKSTSKLGPNLHKWPLFYFCLKMVIIQSIWKNVQLWWTFEFNNLTKSKLHRYPSPMINKGCKWNVGALNDAYVARTHYLPMHFNYVVLLSKILNTWQIAKLFNIILKEINLHYIREMQSNQLPWSH